ncbi:cytochrome c oxidase assembly protein [Azospirillum oryzae]|uniref:Cytochrome c oxidase assembly protein CtaG n=1 Tax=Azospirillum oryzae TaxID=286727 RepID=A0A6N1AKD6_9PROT|nr:cytochrome c oxidase assembly protein [Azospirillum oryzae]KAA0590145.1 cytochrome c oxidase assembly protein [Azospirillum oryzae]QKS51980.1 cytochrome c oxidase assembly protein [Azospirillum oryzae]GLR77990.1 cytochrome c oxidase assembly protein CtaG [Azospirillum oryzae]
MAGRDDKLRRRNRLILGSLFGMVAGMIGLTYASVPLYSLFCSVTGFGGTTQRAEQAAARVVDRKVTIRFNADTNSALPWSFKPEQKELVLKLGETGFAAYRAENRANKPTVGTAVYNVTPEKAGVYFNKIQCFCFDEQILEPGQVVDMPVTFFVDPSMADDANMDDVTTITLSYTFFRAKDSEAKLAQHTAAATSEAPGAIKQKAEPGATATN